MNSLKKHEKTIDMIDRAFMVIRSCEDQKHITSALTYIGLVGREMRHMKVFSEDEIQMALNSLYTFVERHMTVLRTGGRRPVRVMNGYRVKNYDKIRNLLH